MNIGAFVVVLAASQINNTFDIYKWGSLAKNFPFIGICSALFFFSLAGIPPLGGWFAKFVVFRSLLSSSNTFVTVLAVIGAVNAVIALVYYARVVKIIWMDEPEVQDSHSVLPKVDQSLAFVGVFTLVITVVVGFFPNIFGVLGVAATQLLSP